MISRRFLLGSATALAACGSRAETQTRAGEPLKAFIPCPVGATANTAQLDDPAWVAAMLRNVGQITPEWEMKMERVLRPGFAYDFSAADRIVDWAAGHGLPVHGHTLVWYAQGSEVFTDALPRARFEAEFDRYVSTLAGRWKGRVRGWDVVNEAVTDDGAAMRDSHWSRVLGAEAYIERAFRLAHAADPAAVLFLNDYNLEAIPAKARTFLNLVERLLARGVPIGGIGTQSHLDIDMAPGGIAAFMRDAAGLGLPVHVSELDATLYRDGGGPDLRLLSVKRERQTARIGEPAEAFFALPERQRYAFTTWGLRDGDSWLTRAEGRDHPDDSPLLLDREGRPNPAWFAVRQAAR